MKGRMTKIGKVVAAAVLFAWGVGEVAAAPAARKRSPQKPRTAPAAPQAEAILGEVIDRLWTRGDWYWHEGRYEERVALDRMIIRMEPRFIESYGTAGWLLDSMGRDDEALTLYRQATVAAPDRWETHQDLGMFYFQHKDYAAAAASFQRATKCAGAPATAWKMLAHAYEDSGKLEQSLATWKAAARVAPEDPAVGYNLRRVEARLKQRDEG